MTMKLISAPFLCVVALVTKSSLAFAPILVGPRALRHQDASYGKSLAMADTIARTSNTTLLDTNDDILAAVKQLDADRVTELLQEDGTALDEATTDAAFWAVVAAVDEAEANDQAVSPNVPRMLHHIFAADVQHLLDHRPPQTLNLTCMQPKEEGLQSAHQMNYIFDDSSHKDLPLKEGRRCEDGRCCDACSRLIFRDFATPSECSMETFPELASLTFNDLKQVSTATILQFTRLVERVRRTIGIQYGLPLSHILPLQAYSRKYVAGTTQQGGGGGEGDFVTLHTDEATHSGYHYSSVMYLSTQGEDFEGGDFVFNDPSEEEDGGDATVASTEADITSEEDEEEAAAAALMAKLLAGEELPDDTEEAVASSSSGDDIDDDDEEAAAAALMAKLLAGEELPDDTDETDVTSTSDLVDNHWADDDPEEYEDIEYFNSLKDKMRRSGRKLTPFHPTRGAAVIFSSGWENMHEVEKITSGVRYAVPCFFTTSPVPEVAYEQMAVGKPKSDEDIADDWLHLLLARREGETPPESVGRVKELLMKWHYLCTPLSEH